MRLLEIYNNLILESATIVAYHGGGKVTSFSKSHIGSGNNELIYGNGVYFTSDKDMAMDFAFKLMNGYVYTCEIRPTNMMTISERELDKLLFSYMEDGNSDASDFWDNISNKHDVLSVTNRKFGGGMKFPTVYNGFTEYVVYDTDVISIIKTEKY